MNILDQAEAHIKKAKSIFEVIYGEDQNKMLNENCAKISKDIEEKKNNEIAWKSGSIQPCPTCLKLVRPNERDQPDPNKPKYTQILTKFLTQFFLPWRPWGHNQTRNRVQIGFLWFVIVHFWVEPEFFDPDVPTITNPKFGQFGLHIFKPCSTSKYCISEQFLLAWHKYMSN